MMIRLSKLFLAAVLIVSAVCCQPSCSDGGRKTAQTDKTPHDAPLPSGSVAYIFDSEENAGEWYDVGASSALSEYAASCGLSYVEYIPADDTTASRIEAVSSAVEGGADIIVCSGYFSYTAILEAQFMYPDVAFLCVGGAEPDPQFGESLAENTHCIVFCEEDAGYLAGYIAVAEGSVTPGFAAFEENDQTASIFSGFVAGVADAASALGRERVTVVAGRNAVSGGTDADGHLVDRLPEIIFSEGADSVAVSAAQFFHAVRAADASGAHAIPVCYVPEDKSGIDTAFPVYDYGAAAVSALSRFFEGDLSWSVRDAGTCSRVGLAEGAVTAVFDRSSSFTERDLDAIVSSFKTGKTRLTRAERFSDVSNDSVEIIFAE